MPDAETKRTDEQIVLDLHGSRADRGVEVDALENFFENLRRALREFDRDRRGEMVGRGGHPDSRDAAVGAFRLVKFRIGSAILTLEPARPEAGAGAMEMPDVHHRSTSTLSALLDAVEAGETLSPPVLDALSGATRALGSKGHFGVLIPGRHHRVKITPERLDELRLVDEQLPHEVSVTGKLHMLDVAEPTQRVGIRATDGIEWTCAYAPHLKPAVMAAMDKIVTVHGTGRKVTPMAGRMELDRLEVIPEFPQDELFTTDPVPVDELRERQGIHAPQGLQSLSDPDWEDDEASELFLEATLGEIAS